jgi:hypothetical protein
MPHQLSRSIVRQLLCPLSLQGFHDRWQYQPENLDGIREFLEILIGKYATEEQMYVTKALDKIELSGSPCLLAPAPRDYGSVDSHEGAKLNWVRTLDFATLGSEPMERGGPPSQPAQAPAEQELALDLAQRFQDRITIIGGPHLAENTLGLVWSEIAGTRKVDEVWLVPWPMVFKPSSPSEWYQCAKEWNDARDRQQMSPAELREAWFRFNEKRWNDRQPKTKRSRTRKSNGTPGSGGLPREVAIHLGLLAAGIYGLPDDERKKILKETRTQAARHAELEKTAKEHVYSWLRSDHDRLRLAMRPSAADARSEEMTVEEFVKERSMQKLTGRKT